VEAEDQNSWLRRIWGEDIMRRMVAIVGFPSLSGCSKRTCPPLLPDTRCFSQLALHSLPKHRPFRQEHIVRASEVTGQIKREAAGPIGSIAKPIINHCQGGYPISKCHKGIGGWRISGNDARRNCGGSSLVIKFAFACQTVSRFNANHNFRQRV
jgi:hypothetical protein